MKRWSVFRWTTMLESTEKVAEKSRAVRSCGAKWPTNDRSGQLMALICLGGRPKAEFSQLEFITASGRSPEDHKAL